MPLAPDLGNARAPLTMGQLLCAFAYASDIAFGLQLEDCLRSCYLAVRLARAMELPEEQCAVTYYTALLKDAGCTSWTTELAHAWQTDEIVARRELVIFGNPNSMSAFATWMRRFVAKDRSVFEKLSRYFSVLTASRGFFADGFATTAAVAQRIAMRLGMPDGVQTAVLNVFERWDGRGAPNGLRGTQIPRVSRVVQPTFFLVPAHRVGGRDAAVQLARTLRGQACDPAVIDAFLRLASEASFWADLESRDIQAEVLAREPASTLAPMGEEKIDDAAYAFADFIDLKSRYAAAHSRRVGAVAEQLARLMGCSAVAVEQIRRAGLMHDLGLVAIPSYTLERPWGELSTAEQDAYRLHPYHGEQVLKRVPALAPLVEMVGTHHERVDGSGYYRGLTSTNISLGARIIAVADRLDELTHETPGSPALSIAEALNQLDREPLDPEIVAALRRCLGERAAGTIPRQREQPAGLTDREVEVLRFAAGGITRREIGRQLAISENTVRHHLEHIYNKTGTANRVSATLFAMEHGLLAD
ncbi:MAG: HD domain-containing phosphohydrolase [Dehalococcoidia bacterium]